MRHVPAKPKFDTTLDEFISAVYVRCFNQMNPRLDAPPWKELSELARDSYRVMVQQTLAEIEARNANPAASP